MNLSAVVLAGGQSSRMGGVDKGLIEFDGRKMVEWSLDAARPFVSRLLISCNRNITDYMPLADSVVCDRISGSLGPLAGVHAAMEVIETNALLVLPCDTPLITAGLLEKLIVSAAESSGSIIYFVGEAGAHPLHAIIPLALKQSLEDYLIDGGRAVQKWYARHSVVEVRLSAQEESLMVNVNRVEELK